MISFGSSLYENKKDLMLPVNQPTLKLLKECINGMILTSGDDFMKEAINKINEYRKAFSSLSIKSDENVGKILDVKYKSLLSIP